MGPEGEKEIFRDWEIKPSWPECIWEGFTGILLEFLESEDLLVAVALLIAVLRP